MATPPAADPSFDGLHAVHAKVDAKFAEIVGRHPTQFQCRQGCHSCCLPGLTVVAVEAAQIRDYLQAHPAALAAAREIARGKPHGDSRCALLDADGACLVYPVRPALCRAHGAPTLAARSGSSQMTIDSCPLNFTDVNLADLPDDRIGVDLVNTLLFVAGELWQRGSSRRRMRLTLRGLGIAARGR